MGFTVNGIYYTKNLSGYCFKSINGKRSRIKNAEYDAAEVEYIEQLKAEAEESNNDLAAEEIAAEMMDEEVNSFEIGDTFEIAHLCGITGVCRVLKRNGNTIKVEEAMQNDFGKIRYNKRDFEIQLEGHNEYIVAWTYGDEKGVVYGPTLKTYDPEETHERKKTNKSRKSKDIAFEYIHEEDGVVVRLTSKQLDFMGHLKDTCFWEHGIDSMPWIDCLCDEIGGQFAGKPMTVGAMISTLRERGLMVIGQYKVNGKNAKWLMLTELGKATAMAANLGLEE